MAKHHTTHRLLNAKGHPVAFPWTTLNFREEWVTIVDFTPPRHAGSTGRIITKDGAEYYPSVVDARIEEIR